MLVKSDHFTPEFSPRLCRADRKPQGQGESSGSDQAATSDESLDACRLFVNSPPNNKTPIAADFQQQQQPTRFSFDDAPKFGAFADPPSISNRRAQSVEFALPELPLPTFMKMHIKEVPKKEVPVTETNATNPPLLPPAQMRDSQEETGMDSRRSSCSLGPSNISEEFVMVESLKTPFAEGDVSSDAGVFFRECQSAPLSLASFRCSSAIGPTTAKEIGSQLEQFEKDLQDYDDLLKSLCITDSSESK